MFQLYKTIEQLIKSVDEITDAARRQNYDILNRVFAGEFLSTYQVFLTGLLTRKEEYKKEGLVIEESGFQQANALILEAQGRKDYVLVADYLELFLIPLLESVLEAVRENADVVKNTDWNSSNEMRFSKINIPENMEQSKNGNKHYSVEVTQQGPLTLKCCGQDGEFYFHSNVNPWYEADVFAKEYGDDTVKEYAVLGMGLGYHAIKLWQRSAGAVPVSVFEPDVQVLRMAKHYQDFRICTGRKFHIIYDPELKCLSDKLKDSEVRLVIHYPSLRNIANIELRKVFERFFVLESSERNQRKYLCANFISNISESVNPAEKLMGKWKGKDVYIVAAGPSLDKNIECLKERPKNSIILAVGTVLTKMLRMNIRPDYVIVSDANERIVKQINSNNNCGVPMLLLSTAYYRFAQDYQAEKYILLQEDFAQAEQYAKEHHQMLFQTGGSVGTTALDAAIRLGAGRIIFLGLDLAFTDNLAHASGTSNQLAVDETELTAVKAFDGGTVYSDIKFSIYANWIEERLQKEDARNIPVINATEGGRYLDGMQYMTLKSVIEQK